jgi:hypothetical protein
MEVWSWILVYAAALILLQILVYRYLWRQREPLAGEGYSQWHDRARSRASNHRREREEAARRRRARAAEAAESEGDPSPPPAGNAGDGGRTCHHCGARNEADGAFTRCWNCAERIG